MKTPIKTRPIFLVDDPNYDPLFGYNANGVFNKDDKIGNDYERQIFSTSKNVSVFCVARNNIATGVRVRTELANRMAHTNMKQNKSVTLPDMFQGVYVIEKFYINKEAYSNAYDAINYIRNTNNVELDHDQLEGVREMLSHSSPHSRSHVIRLVHFVAIEELIKNHEVYLSSLDIVLTINKPDDNTMHPMSNLGQASKANVRVSEYAEPNIIAVDITNVDHPGKVYYMKIGSTIHKLISTTNEDTPSSYSIVVKHRGNIVENVRGDLTDIDKVGIYETYDEANYNGNSELVLKYATLETNLETLKRKSEMEEYKLTNEKLKIENELTVLKEKRRQEKEKWELEKTKRNNELEDEKKKREHELKVLREKHEADMKMLTTKHKNELELHEQKYKQSVLDYDKKAMDNKHMMEKYIMDIGILKRKHVMEIQIFKEKVISERNKRDNDLLNNNRKNNTDMIKSVLDIVGKVFMLSTAMLK